MQVLCLESQQGLSNNMLGQKFIERVKAGIFMETQHIVPKGTTAAPTTTTTAAPTTTTTAAPTTTTAGPTTTTATPTTTTTATPTTTTAAPTNTRLLTQGLMMRFFGWDDPYTDTTSSFGNNQTVDVNGSQVTRDVIYPSYQDSSLPQLTGAFSTSNYSNWADATEEITDVNNVKHTGVYLKDGYYMTFHNSNIMLMAGNGILLAATWIS